MASMRALVLLMCCIVSWLVRMCGIGGGLMVLVVYCVIMCCLSVLTGSRELFWVSSHMVKICSIPCRRLVYAWSSRRRFLAVRGIHDQYREFGSFCSMLVAICVF